MQAKEKLEEVRYFLEEMRRVKDNPTQFTYELSAFLSAARSVDYYLRHEATGNPALQTWHKGIVAQVTQGIYPNTRYFIDKRDHNVHASMLTPRKGVKFSLTTKLHPTVSVSVTIFDKAGNIIECRKPNPDPPAPPIPAEATVTRVDTYHFADRSGEDLFDTCQAYVDELTQMVAEAETVIAGQS